MGELREVQLRVGMIVDDWTSDFFKTVKHTTVRIYAPTLAKQILKGLECRPKLASLS